MAFHLSRGCSLSSAFNALARGPEAAWVRYVEIKAHSRALARSAGFRDMFNALSLPAEEKHSIPIFGRNLPRATPPAAPGGTPDAKPGAGMPGASFLTSLRRGPA